MGTLSVYRHAPGVHALQNINRGLGVERDCDKQVHAYGKRRIDILAIGSNKSSKSVKTTELLIGAFSIL
ncbi:hypothetical protein [Desulfosarcina widdelii]|uniref:hypothetical protein n=1 Tax=Desulfosarcina widdelii TaxID=947919 RepID=UPI0012D2EFFC|nr:hypothetical protein [Desulfosarcina widdelii]